VTFDPDRALTKEEHDELVKIRNRPVTQDAMSKHRTPPVHVPRRTWLENFLAGLIGRDE